MNNKKKDIPTSFQTDDERKKMIVPKAYYITNTNARWRITSPLKTILNYRTEKKIYLLRNVLSLEIMTIFAAKKNKNQ